MAKYSLWGLVVLIFMFGLIAHYNGETLDLFTKILLWSALGILALCESIEKLNKKS